ncbi:MAG: hypothetical protein EOQ92_31010 [Mesorhizobium sp.]|nr:MAG: hypothetical protein EOQ92_31010 [Mesorhizobium sp.]RWK46052.1 MAG: hypothetical protein EOR47_27980 [Mesorhizobium sp.]RWK90169.1 MAG: hypothetical protein EOR53_31105 [Mesorhizobium sp.]TIP54960.1 MAG: hypothetical protein E5X56_30705 [Mesorhizobium sp.]TIQ25997.1 MAG: hypothetical protein E5X54_27725 [Mesorhizobium sp.]
MISPPYGRGPPSVLPDISPSRGEIGCRFGFRQSRKMRYRRSCQSPPLRGEMSGRTEGGTVPPTSADLGLYLPNPHRLTRDFSQRSKATARIRIRPMTMLCV